MMMIFFRANSGSLIDDIAAAKGVSTTRIANVMDAVSSYMILIKSFMDEVLSCSPYYKHNHQ